MRRTGKILAIVTGIALGAIVLVYLAVRLGVDAEVYRSVIKSRLEQASGRDVEFGEMRVAFWPVIGLQLDELSIGALPGEREPRLLTAESLSVGARIGPLLRRRLEITSLVVQRPSLRVWHTAEGNWEPSRIVAGSDDGTEGAESAGESALSIRSLRLVDGSVELNFEAAPGATPQSLKLGGIALELDEVGTGRPLTFDLTVVLTELGEARARIRGSREVAAGDATVGRLKGQIEVQRLDPSRLARLLAQVPDLPQIPDDLLDARTASLSVGFDLDEAGSRLTLDPVQASGIGLNLSRSATGAWNVDSLLETGGTPAPETQRPATTVRVGNVELTDVSVSVEGRRGRPETRVTLDQGTLRLTATEADGRVSGRLGARLRAPGSGPPAGVQATLAWTPGPADTDWSARGTLEVKGLPAAAVEALSDVHGLPSGTVGGRPFDVSATCDVDRKGPNSHVRIHDVVLKNLDVRLPRDAQASAGKPGAPAPAAAAGKPGASAATLDVRGLRVENGSLSLADGLSLDNVSGSLDRLPTDAAAQIEVDANLRGTGAATGKLALRGKLGPLAADPVATPLELTLRINDVGLAALASQLPPMPALAADAAKMSGELTFQGQATGRLGVRGEVSLAGARVRVETPTRGTIEVPLDVRAAGDLTLRDRAQRIELAELRLDLPRQRSGAPLVLRGSVNLAEAATTVDLNLARSRIAADELAALAALVAPDLPFSFSASEPIEFELAVRGPLAADRLPDLRGRAVLSGGRLRVDGLTQPVDPFQATIQINGERIVIEGLRAVLGGSDVNGRVVIDGFATPRVELEVESRKADFWELFSFVLPETESASKAKPAASGGGWPVRVEGKLAIQEGSLGALTFSGLRGGIRFAEGVLTLDPLSMALYGGRFDGRLVQDLNVTPAALVASGKIADVAADPFLAANLELPGVLSGKAAAQMDVRLSSGDWSTISSTLTGGGPLRVVEGHLAQLEPLRPLSKVSGVFGERTMQRLSKQVATRGTDFRSIDVRLGFDGGRVGFEELLLITNEFELRGDGIVELAASRMQGQFALLLTPEISQSMRDEGSRAAEIFWDPSAGRVRVPFALEGPLAEPSASIDWKSSARDALERKVGDDLRRLLDRSALKLKSKAGAAPGGAGTGGLPPVGSSGTAGTNAPGSAPPSDPGPPASGATGSGSAVTGESGAKPADATTPGAAPGADSGTPPAVGSTLQAAITRTRWGSSLVLRDLTIEGTLAGSRLQRASLTVIDARGKEVKRLDPLPALQTWRDGAADPDGAATIPWKVSIDGKRLALATFPLDVTLTVVDATGASAQATRRVE